MPRFIYTAQDQDGKIVTGELEAANAGAARAQLARRGFSRLRVANDGPALDSAEADQLAVAIADVAEVELPLAEGLRAAAEESSARRLSSVLRELADLVEKGETIDAALVRLGPRVPEHVAGMVAAAARSGRMHQVLTELVRLRLASRTMWTETILAIAYPTVVLMLGLFLFCAFGVTIVGQFVQIFEEFSLQLPLSTRLLVWWSNVGAWIGFASLLLACGFLVFTPMVASVGRFRRMMAGLPLVGVLLHWSGVIEMTRMLSILLDSGAPLPEALRLTSLGVRDSGIAEVCNWMAEQSEKGLILSDAISASGRLPRSMIPLTQWGERNGRLPEALISVAEQFERRVQMRSAVIRTVYPPIPFVFIGSLMGYAVVSLMLPLVSLIRNLT